MSVAYLYQPPTGPLPGASFETQTELFFAAIQEEAQQATVASESALSTAQTAEANTIAAISVANQAAQSASAAVAEAQAATQEARKALYSLISTCTNAGTWAIGGVTIGKPLFVITEPVEASAEAVSIVGGGTGGPVLAFIPSSSSITINVPSIVPGTKLKAYQ